MQAGPVQLGGCLVQAVDGQIRILADWVMDGPPAESLERLWLEAVQVAGSRNLKLAAPPAAQGRYADPGLWPAARRLKLEVIRLADDGKSGEGLRPYLRGTVRGQPALQASEAARWTVNGLAGGYCYPQRGRDAMASVPEDGPYRLMLGGLEAFAAFLKPLTQREDDVLNWQTTADGRRYISARATPERGHGTPGSSGPANLKYRGG
jgi:hypothetical protein